MVIGAVVVAALLVVALVLAIITATTREDDSDHFPNDFGPAPALMPTTVFSEPTANSGAASVYGPDDVELATASHAENWT